MVFDTIIIMLVLFCNDKNRKIYDVGLWLFLKVAMIYSPFSEAHRKQEKFCKIWFQLTLFYGAIAMPIELEVKNISEKLTDLQNEYFAPMSQTTELSLILAHAAIYEVG